MDTWREASAPAPAPAPAPLRLPSAASPPGAQVAKASESDVRAWLGSPTHGGESPRCLLPSSRSANPESDAPSFSSLSPFSTPAAPDSHSAPSSESGADADADADGARARPSEGEQRGDGEPRGRSDRNGGAGEEDGGEGRTLGQARASREYPAQEVCGVGARPQAQAGRRGGTGAAAAASFFVNHESASSSCSQPAKGSETLPPESVSRRTSLSRWDESSLSGASLACAPDAAQQALDFTYARAAGSHHRPRGLPSSASHGLSASARSSSLSFLQHPAGTLSSPASPGYASLPSWPQAACLQASAAAAPHAQTTAALSRWSTHSFPQQAATAAPAPASAAVPDAAGDAARQRAYAYFFAEKKGEEGSPRAAARGLSSRLPTRPSGSASFAPPLSAARPTRERAQVAAAAAAAAAAAPAAAPAAAAEDLRERAKDAEPRRQLSNVSHVSSALAAGGATVKQRTVRKVTSSGSVLPADGADVEVAQASQYGDLQVLVDIDDTLRSSGGVTFLSVSLGGIDTQYERGSFYPGCFQFLLELSIYGLRKDQKPLSLGVLTARIPQVPITADSMLNQKLRETAQRRGIRGWGIDCKNKVLYSTLNEWIFPSEKGKRKFENLMLLHSKLSASHPNIRYVWIGDTGEMDRHAGEMMAREMPHAVKAIFLHFVGDYGRNSKMPRDYFVNGVPLVFFRTYIRAARRAVDLGLLDKRGLARTMVQAVADLDAMHNTPSVSTKWRDIIFDVRDAEALVPLKGATLPPLVRTREVLHRRITEIKGALERFRAKRGGSSSSLKSQQSIGDAKALPAAVEPARGHEGRGASHEKAPLVPAKALSLHDARRSSGERLPAALVERAAEHQREDEQRRRDRARSGQHPDAGDQESFDVLAPASASQPSSIDPQAGSGETAEELWRLQEQASSASESSGAPEESSWVEVRFDRATGCFPVLDARGGAGGREGSWRPSRADKHAPDGGTERPFYQTLLTHPSSQSSSEFAVVAEPEAADARAGGELEAAEGAGRDRAGRERRSRPTRDENEDLLWERVAPHEAVEGRRRSERRDAEARREKEDIELLDLAPRRKESGQASEGAKKKTGREVLPPCANKHERGDPAWSPDRVRPSSPLLCGLSTPLAPETGAPSSPSASASLASSSSVASSAFAAPADAPLFLDEPQELPARWLSREGEEGGATGEKDRRGASGHRERADKDAHQRPAESRHSSHRKKRAPLDLL